jgi:hypothetical protein
VHQPGVTITDFLLTCECAVFLFLLLKVKTKSPVRAWFALLFGALGLAALAGAVTHGWVLDTTSLEFAITWKTTLIALGLMALACTNLAVSIHSSTTPGASTRVLQISLVIFAAYVLYVLTGPRKFVTAVAIYIPAILFMLGSATKLATTQKYRPSWELVVGIVLTLVASAIQQLKWGFNVLFLDHNSLYHLIEAVALIFIYRFGTSFLRDRTSAD